MRRREFITLLGGAAATWPLAASGSDEPPLPTNGDVVVNTSVRYQTMDGFGASDALLSDLSPELLDLFFSESNGIGLSIIRAFMDPNGGLFFWKNNSWANKQGAVARGAKVFATPISPPAAFKSNGSVKDGGTLLPDHYGSWADMIVAFINEAAQNGVPLHAVSIQNEPNFGPDYESCIYSPQEMVEFLKVLGPKVTQLINTPLIMLPETSGQPWSYVFAAEADPVAFAYAGIYAAHQYSAPEWPQSHARSLWETEYSTFDAFDPSIENGLNVAQAVFDAIVTGNVTAWNYWELVGNDPAFELEDNEALIGHKADGPGNPTLTKRLFTLGNFSKFVRPGHIRVATSGGVSSGVSIVSFVNPNDDMPVVVAINATGSSTSLGISLQGSSPSIVIPWVTSTWQNLEPQGQVQVLDGGFTATLPAQSVTTFVGQH